MQQLSQLESDIRGLVCTFPSGLTSAEAPAVSEILTRKRVMDIFAHMPEAIVQELATTGYMHPL
jgi:hypothetical protein